jgi:hypothetical protein
VDWRCSFSCIWRSSGTLSENLQVRHRPCLKRVNDGGMLKISTQNASSHGESATTRAVAKSIRIESVAVIKRPALRVIPTVVVHRVVVMPIESCCFV